jgi:hypothetical protein
LRHALSSDPTLWQRYGDLAEQATESWLVLLAGRDLMLHESARQKMEALRKELSGPDPSPLEKLLVERVVACWLQVHYADATYAQAKGPQHTPGLLAELMKRQESSQRRFLASVQKLALVRKLIRPAPSPLELAARNLREGPPATTRVPRAPSRAESVTLGVPVLN